jgi:hypothetical protein
MSTKAYPYQVEMTYYVRAIMENGCTLTRLPVKWTGREFVVVDGYYLDEVIEEVSEFYDYPHFPKWKRQS